MPQQSSPNSTPPGMPGFNPAHKGKYSAPHFATMAEFTAAITPGATGYSADLWLVGQQMTIAGEPSSCYRVWNGTHARTVVVGGIRSVVLAANTNVVSTTSGAPTGGAAGDMAVDEAASAYYIRGSIQWGDAVAVYGAAQAATVATSAPYALAGNGRATVIVPALTGRNAAGCIVQASTGQTATGPASGGWIVVTGLTNGTAVTFRVAGVSAAGVAGPYSLPSRSVTPSAIAGIGDVGIDPILYFHPHLQGLTNGAQVATLTDYSGNGFNASNPSGGIDQPTAVTNAINGKTVISGDGNQMLYFPCPLQKIGSAFIDISVWALNSADPQDTAYYSNFLPTDGLGMRIDAFGTASQTAPRFRCLLGQSNGGTLSNAGTAASILSMEFPGVARLNGAKQTLPAATGASQPLDHRWQIFGYGGGNRRLNGICAHFSRWPRSMTNAQRWLVEAYLSAQFGQAVTQS